AGQDADTGFRQQPFHQPTWRRGFGAVVVVPAPGLCCRARWRVAFGVFLRCLCGWAARKAADVPADVSGIDDLRSLALCQCGLERRSQRLGQYGRKLGRLVDEVASHAADVVFFLPPIPFGGARVVTYRITGRLENVRDRVLEWQASAQKC